MKAQQNVKIGIEVAHQQSGHLGAKTQMLVTSGTDLPFKYHGVFWDDYLRAGALACITLYIDNEEVHAESKQIPLNALEDAAEVAWSLTAGAFGAEPRRYQREAYCELNIDNNGAGTLKVYVGVGGENQPKAVYSPRFAIKTSSDGQARLR